MEKINPEEYYGTNKFSQDNMECLELPSNETEPNNEGNEYENQKEQEEEIQNNPNSHYSFTNFPFEQKSSEYYALQYNYEELSKEKEMLMKSLNDEIVKNEQQRNQIEILKQKLNEANHSNNQSQNYSDMILSNNNLTKDNNEYKTKIEGLNKQIELFQGETKKWNEEKEILSHKLIEAENNINKLNELCAEKEKTCNNMIIANKKEKDKLVEEIKNTTNQIEVLNSEKVKMEKENEYLKITKENLYKDIQNKVNEIDKLKETIKEAEKQQQNKQNEDNKGNDNKLLELIKLKDEQIKEFIATNKELEGIVNQYKKIIEKINNENKLIKNELGSKNEKIISLSTSQKVEMDKTLSQLQETNNNLTQNSEQLKETLQKYKTMHKEVEEKLLISERKVEKYKEEIKSINKQLTEKHNELLECKGQLSAKAQISSEQISKLTIQLNQLHYDYTSQTEKYTSIISDKDIQIQNLKFQIDNPQSNPNYTLYQPRLAVQSCLTASKILLENAHKFYTEEYFNNFLDCVDYLRRELTICYQALNQDDNFEVRYNNLMIQYQKRNKECDFLREENRRLEAFCDRISEDNRVYKEINEFICGLIERILKYYLTDDLSQQLNKFFCCGIKLVYREFEMKNIERRIQEGKEILSKVKQDKDKGQYYSLSDEIKEVNRLEKEKNVIQEQMEYFNKGKWEAENHLGLYEKNLLEKRNFQIENQTNNLNV